MARPGVTYNDVAKAAIEISGQGKLPTIDNIRLLLRTGSSSTIAPHLRTWKSKQNDTLLIASKEKLPEDFVALMKGLWDRVLQEAQTQVSIIEQNADKNLSEQKQQLDTLIQEYKCLQQQYNQLLQREQQLAMTSSLWNKSLFDFRMSKLLHRPKQTFHQRLSDKQERIDEFQRLNRQVQNNLDRYREASREQRLKEQKQYESQIKYLEQSAQKYTQENNHFKEQLKININQLDQLQNDYQILKNEYYAITTKLNEMKSHFAINQDKLNSLQKSEIHWKMQYQGGFIQLENHKKEIADLKNQLVFLSQQLLNLEDQLTVSNQQNQLLAHEKWQLGQKTALLTGQLKQIEIKN